MKIKKIENNEIDENNNKRVKYITELFFRHSFIPFLYIFSCFSSFSFLFLLVAWPTTIPPVESTHLLWTLDDRYVLSACHEKKERIVEGLIKQT